MCEEIILRTTVINFQNDDDTAAVQVLQFIKIPPFIIAAAKLSNEHN
jgi:hypothetical protein